MARGKRTGANGAHRAIANLAIGASLVLAACGTSQALSGTGQSGQSAVVRDPDNPYWTGAHVAGAVIDGEARPAVIRDPDNPFWTGANASADLVGGAATDPRARGPR